MAQKRVSKILFNDVCSFKIYKQELNFAILLKVNFTRCIYYMPSVVKGLMPGNEAKLKYGVCASSVIILETRSNGGPWHV